MAQPSPACETCHFWEKQALPADHGRCHRFPPRMARDEGDTNITRHLIYLTRKDDWCGEYQKA